MTNPDWSVVLLRYFNPIGAHESGQIGEDPTGIPNNLVPYITQTALGKLEKLYVLATIMTRKMALACETYPCADLAQGHVDAVNFASKTPDAGNQLRYWYRL